MCVSSGLLSFVRLVFKADLFQLSVSVLSSFSKRAFPATLSRNHINRKICTMKTAFVILGCLLVVALSDYAQSKAIVDLETRDVAADSKEMNGEDLFSDAVESKIIDVVRDLVVRATEKEGAEGQGGTNLFAVMQRLSKAVQIIRTRDIHAGIEFVKQLLIEFFFQK